ASRRFDVSCQGKCGDSAALFVKVVFQTEVRIANSRRTTQTSRRIVCYCDERAVEIKLESLSQSIIDPHIERVLPDMRSLSTLQPIMLIEFLDVHLSGGRHIGIIRIKGLLSESEVRIQEDERTTEQDSHWKCCLAIGQIDRWQDRVRDLALVCYVYVN